MKILIPGGSGHLGQLLTPWLTAAGHEVTIFSLRPGTPVDVEGFDVIINLAGRSVNCRYHAANRHEIMESRVATTRAIGKAIRDAAHPPHLWLQSSTATLYRHRFDAPNDENHGEIGGDEANVPDTWRFSIDVARAWEAALNEESLPRTRRVAMRMAMVMSAAPGGAFEAYLRLAKFGLGGRAGSGEQFVSWIHERDFLRAIDFLIADDRLIGPVNLAAPSPLPNREFMQTIRRAARIPFGIPLPNPLLELGAWMMKTETELVLKSRRVTPARLLEAGFEFEFPTWQRAAADLIASPGG